MKKLDFKPHPLFRGGHLQTLAGFYWPSRHPPHRADLLLIDVSDGDKIALHDDCPPSWKRNDPVTLLVHGLAGCHGSGYMVRIAEKLNDRGIRTFRMDMRGSGAASGLARLPGHAGRAEDAALAIEAIHERCPDAPLTLVGFSMGGNIALNTLANASRSEIGNLCRGIAVAPPVDLSRCCRELRTGVRNVYDKYLIRFLIRNWLKTGGQLHGSRPRSIYQFDDQITAPLCGYTDAEDYYADSSSYTRLHEISVPTRILAAEDDPVVAFSAISDAIRSDDVDLFITDSGGHLGYFARHREISGGRWLDHLIVDWVCRW